MLKTASVAFLVGMVLFIGFAIWQANNPDDDIFEAYPPMCPSGTELHDTGREATRTCAPTD